jgi:hypothetical protein
MIIILVLEEHAFSILANWVIVIIKEQYRGLGFYIKELALHSNHNWGQGLTSSSVSTKACIVAKWLVLPAVTRISVSGFEFCHKSSGLKSYF